MLATVMNCIYVSDIFRFLGMQTDIFTPFQVGAMTELFSKDRAVASLKAGKVIFLAGGTGHPYFSTDTGVVLRAVETEADVILLAKNVDGIYDSDPALNPSAVRYDTLPIEEVVRQGLKAVDLTASVLAMENRIPMRVVALQEENSIIRAASGEFNGTTSTV
jgi:uridylate kinase